MANILDFVSLMRVRQWYKNLIIFAPAFFAGRISQLGMIESLFIGFLSLCLISSSGYVINDIIDAGMDKAHPAKKNRAIARGAVGKNWAATFAAILAIIGILIPIGFGLGMHFLFLAAILLALMQAYNLWLKRIAFLDVNALALNYIVRSFAGAAIAGVVLSEWFFLGAYLLALFLALAKRRADLSALGNAAKKYKAVMEVYTLPILDKLLQISAALLLGTYMLYTFQSPAKNAAFLLGTIPLVFFCTFRYMWLATKTRHSGGISPGRMAEDLPIAISGALTVFLFCLAIYF